MRFRGAALPCLSRRGSPPITLDPGAVCASTVAAGSPVNRDAHPKPWSPSSDAIAAAVTRESAAPTSPASAAFVSSAPSAFSAIGRAR